MQKPHMDIAVIGGGAAGFFAAISAKETNRAAHVSIYESGSKVLSKVAITGGGRCNLTNSFKGITDIRLAYPRGHRLMKRLLKKFGHEDTYRWFESRGVPLTTQPDQCVFPRSQNAMDIVDCLCETAQGLGVDIHTGHRVCGIGRFDNGFSISFANGKSVVAGRVIIATGGSPKADGLGYLAELGQDITPPVPSLFTLCIGDSGIRSLTGIVVENTEVSIPSTKFKAAGPLLATHWGVSGPAVLKLSSYAARHLAECGYACGLSVDWISNIDREQAGYETRSAAMLHPKGRVVAYNPFNLPSRLWEQIVAKAGLPYGRKWAEIGGRGFNKLVETLKNSTYRVTGKGAFKEEFVTCGGVSVSGIDMVTLESKAAPGLYFAGEVMDVDGITGGFNLQAAWTTGLVAGESCAKSI